MSKRILVIDPEEAIRTVLAEALLNEGYLVETAVNYPDAVEKLQKDNGFDMVITDLISGENDPWEFIANLKIGTFKKDYAVIVMTAFADLKNAIDSKRAGCDDFVDKPFDLTDILTRVQKVFAGTRPAQAI